MTNPPPSNPSPSHRDPAKHTARGSLPPSTPPVPLVSHASATAGRMFSSLHRSASSNWSELSRVCSRPVPCKRKKKNEQERGGAVVGGRNKREKRKKKTGKRTARACSHHPANLLRVLSFFSLSCQQTNLTRSLTEKPDLSVPASRCPAWSRPTPPGCRRCCPGPSGPARARSCAA